MALLAPILVLGLVIFIHELGHFLAAKFFGVYAPRFAIGFGPTLWSKRWGETEYVIGALPLGGYVRMATRDDEAASVLEGDLDEAKGGKGKPLDPDAMIPFGPKPVPKERWFESKPLWQRAIILLAGVTMNVILAVVVLTAIVAAYGRPYLRPVVAAVVDGSPAAAAGLLARDSIVAVNGAPVRRWVDVVDTVSRNPNKQVVISVMRGSTRVDVPVTPDTATELDAVTGEPRIIGRVGMQADSEPLRDRVSPGRAIADGASITVRMAGDVFTVLKGLVTGNVGVSNLGGPITIIRASVQTARSGFENLLSLIAFLSINLAILNLVPIPLLDGGQLVLQTAETIKGGPFSDRTREWIARIGLAAIALLFITVTFNDIKRLVLTWIS
jgi:regulator of sigma E protease